MEDPVVNHKLKCVRLKVLKLSFFLYDIFCGKSRVRVKKVSKSIFFSFGLLPSKGRFHIFWQQDVSIDIDVKTVVEIPNMVGWIQRINLAYIGIMKNLFNLRISWGTRLFNFYMLVNILKGFFDYFLDILGLPNKVWKKSFEHINWNVQIYWIPPAIIDVESVHPNWISCLFEPIRLTRLISIIFYVVWYTQGRCNFKI